MAFTEALKKKVRDRADGRCCMGGCHKVDIDIHHIVPQAKGGPDTEDNAAPLCAGCHRAHGGDSGKRKMIREHRDRWYKSVAGKGSGSVVRASPYMSFSNCRYSFVRYEFIHPLIIKELLGWLSDKDEAVAAVNLTAANRSNRFFGDFTTYRHDETLFVKWEDGRELFAYAHIATSPSGIEMVDCTERRGSGVFRSIGLFYLEQDRAVEYTHRSTPETKNILTRERAIIKTLGSIDLGDRYDGRITYSKGILSIGPDIGWFNRGEGASQAVEVP